MAERGVIFTAWSIQRIQRGVKTQTRRLHPLGAVGDRLWVRETWSPDGAGPGEVYPCPGVWFRADFSEYDDPARRKNSDGEFDCIQHADRWRKKLPRDGNCLECWAMEYGFQWRSPRFMPRWASRITLTITAVREEPLQALTEEDARAEGVDPNEPIEARINGERGTVLCMGPDAARKAYAMLWDGMHGVAAPWRSNPTVFVHTFEARCGVHSGPIQSVASRSRRKGK